MNQDRWAAVDHYITDLLVRPDPALEAALADSDAAGLPSINVSPNHGKLLHLLARLQGARTILEIGTLGGYSTIWLARALPADGRLITIESNPKHAEVARANIARPGLSRIVDVRLGPALETLPQIAAEGLGPFRPDLYRCRQAQQSGLLGVGTEAHTARELDRDRQRRAERGGDRCCEQRP
jgi:predicted O-methyltransferase YrrM